MLAAIVPSQAPAGKSSGDEFIQYALQVVCDGQVLLLRRIKIIWRGDLRRKEIRRRQLLAVAYNNDLSPVYDCPNSVLWSDLACFIKDDEIKAMNPGIKELGH